MATFGLLVRYRPYRCDCCGHIDQVQTNHTGSILHVCPGCSWRGARDSTGKWYRADIGKHRPHEYIGPEPGADEVNPYWKGQTT
jgi:hypothetical protein